MQERERNHGLRTSNEGTNQRIMKIWADMEDKIYLLWLYIKIWEWELIFARAVNAISSLGVHSPYSLAFLPRDREHHHRN